MLLVVLLLGMGGVAVLQPFGPGREMVCIGQLWSDSTAGDIVLCHLLHLFAFMAAIIHPSWVPHFLTGCEKHGCGLAVVAVLPSALCLNGDISLRASHSCSDESTGGLARLPLPLDKLYFATCSGCPWAGAAWWSGW